MAHSAARRRKSPVRHLLTIDAGHGITAAMLLAALLDLGAPAPLLRQDVARLGGGEVRMSWVRVQRQGSPALVASVRAPQQTPSLTTPAEVQDLLGTIDLDRPTAALAAAALDLEHRTIAEVAGRTTATLTLSPVTTLDQLALSVAIASAVTRMEITRATLLGAVGLDDTASGDRVVEHLADTLPTVTRTGTQTDRLGIAWLRVLDATLDGAGGNPLAVGRGAPSGAGNDDVLRLQLHPRDPDAPTGLT